MVTIYDRNDKEFEEVYNSIFCNFFIKIECVYSNRYKQAYKVVDTDDFEYTIITQSFNDEIINIAIIQ